MRLADLLLLSLAALWQQKLRTALTTLGVAFGALVLFVSLSLGIGVQDTIVREARKHDELRRIGVYPKWETDASAATPVIEIKGRMSEARRERLKLTAQTRIDMAARRRQLPITVEHLVQFAGLEHVERVKPSIYLDAWVHHAGKAEHAAVVALHPAERHFDNKILSGGLLNEADGRGILVSEYLLYRWGLGDDADLQSALGKTIRLELRGRREPSAGLRFSIIREGAGAESREEAILRERILARLPEALKKIELSAAERALLDAWLTPKEQAPTPTKELVLDEAFTIVGVFRMPTKEDGRWPWMGNDYFADLALPVETAQELFLRLVQHDKEPGFTGAMVVVDREEHVKQVQERIQALGFHTDAFIELIQRDQFLYRLIFAGMTCVAGVALLVAALGITNTMLMSVLERTREVGIMKAVGAAEEHIQMIFLIEGSLIGLVGGGLGVLLSWAGSFPGDRWIRSMVNTEMKLTLEESLFAFPGWLTAAVILFCGLVTTLAAAYPARRASRVNAVTALRHE